MENRKLVKFLIPIFISGFFITQSSTVFAYSIKTHAFLTDEVIKFYNQNFSNNKISNDLKDYLIDGSRREDDIPRWMNHFYDPVYNRGLVDSVLRTWQKSKDWAQDSNNQNKLTYKVSATVASILTAIQQKKLSLISDETDFTWHRAVRLYVQGDTEKAMFLLGHILHLIEDASVPDHTRNDPHPGDSPYENWTEKFTLNNPDKALEQRLKNKEPSAFNNLNSYFDELAKYSNNNFYSKDRIGKESGYSLPEIDTEGLLKKDGDYYYIGRYDENNNLYYLAVYKNYRNSLLIETKSNLVLKIEDEDKVVSDYWSRLSTKSVQYGAGVINLFFQEVEKAKNDPNFAKQEKKSFFGQVIDTTKNLANQVGNFFSANFGSNQDFQSAGEVSLQTEESEKGKGESQIETVQSIGQTKIDNSQKTQSQTQQVQTQKSDSSSKLQQQIIEEDEEVQPLQKKQAQSSQKQATTTQQQTQTQTTPTFKECSFSTTQSPSRQKIIINEVAWMGTSASANDEWIELKNILGSEIDLSGWQLLDAKEDVKVVFGEEDKRGIINKKISTNGFYLLERTDDDSVPGIIADFVYSGALSNSDEGLRLFDGQCNLIDEVLANPGWPAGNNTSAAERKTMERNSGDFNWHTSSVIGGTPKQNNSTPAVVYSGGGGGGVSATTQQQITDNTQQPKILINEIQTYPTGERFIELYNPGNAEVNLTDWYIQRKTQTGNEFTPLVSKTYFEGKIIPANGYLLISRSASADSDIVISDLTLTESNTIQLKNSNQEVVDKVGWGSVSDFEGSGPASSPTSSQSIQRKFQNNSFVDTDNNANDFEILTCPSPRAQSRSCENAQAPTQTVGANHIVISEIQVTGGIGQANDEFIEFYNPTDSAIPLAGYSIQYLSGTATSTEKIGDNKRNFENNAQIAAKSFYLLTHINATSSLKGDMTYSAFSLSGSSNGATIFLVGTTTPISSINDSAIVDTLSYGSPVLAVQAETLTVPGANQSLERKAFATSTIDLMVSSEHRFSGNGQDTDSADDFILRNSAEPQNSASLPEPRTSPAAPSGFTIQYSSSTMELVFNWSASQDYSGATSNIAYEIQEYSSPGTVIHRSTSTAEFRKDIDEVNRDYNFSIQTFDREGLGSEMVSSTISVPSFLKEFYFYQDPRNELPKYLLEFDYNSYPFLPDTRLSPMSAWPAAANWKTTVFYFNQEAPKDEFMRGTSALNPQAVLVKYKKCNGFNSEASSLILPDTSNNCRYSGEVYSNAFSNLEDNRILLDVYSDLGNVTSTNYISVAYYGFHRLYPQGSDQSFAFNNFKLIAVDKIKYYFQNEPPVHQPPTALSDLQLSFNGDTSKLTISFSTANITDPDSVDGLITYQFNYTTSTESNFNESNWQQMYLGGATATADFDVVFNNTYLIGVRATDNLGNFSLATTTWSFPENFVVIQQQNRMESEFNGGANAVAQVFRAAHSGFAKSIKFITHGFFNGRCGIIQAFLYDTDNPKNASSENLLASSNQKIVWGTYDAQTHILTFQNPPLLEEEQIYTWIVEFSGIPSTCGGVSSNLKGTNGVDSVGGSGWARFSSWSSGGSYDAANNYYFVLFGSTSP